MKLYFQLYFSIDKFGLEPGWFVMDLMFLRDVLLLEHLIFWVIGSHLPRLDGFHIIDQIDFVVELLDEVFNGFEAEFFF
jgi:hypothetical protein